MQTGNFREYTCVGKKEKDKVSKCRGITEALIGSDREKLSLCPECYDTFEKMEDEKKVDVKTSEDNKKEVVKNKKAKIHGDPIVELN
jgi:hypothetical protein